MKETLARVVRRRAAGRCEDCRLPQEAAQVSFEIDHAIARKHDGKAVASNLALACFDGGGDKGSEIAGLDPEGGRLTPSFHPRRHEWDWHFRWDGPRLVGRTAIGRTTIRVRAEGIS